ncbi:cupin domain-containing protein [Arthrobacter sp. OAP107]|uniref:cupin domain-containing protein n=1 Tax=Arthrobacter sp. OAP107 TaxID=3156445 RepID=UPI0033990225
MNDNSTDLSAPARRVIVGINASKASAVVADERNVPSTRLPNGIVLQELWQQRSIPAAPDDHPEPGWTLGPDAPAEGAVVRILTVPGASGDTLAVPNLHTDHSLHVITMLDGELAVVLEDGEVTLAKGDSIVLRGSMHDLRNVQPRPASFVYTSFPLAISGSKPL